LAAFTIFVLPLLGVFSQLINNLPDWFDDISLVVFWGIIFFTLGLLVVRRFPRRPFSYLGFILQIGLVLSQYHNLWVWTYALFLDTFGPRAGWSLMVRILYAGVHETLM
jgi:hypothetical protein